jgi:hypothetical protein
VSPGCWRALGEGYRGFGCGYVSGRGDGRLAGAGLGRFQGSVGWAGAIRGFLGPLLYKRTPRGEHSVAVISRAAAEMLNRMWPLRGYGAADEEVLG